ncbi:hypothetical protein M378DRAFT_113290 [Amanita muscaria Koide BX008]|uniref:ATP-dependent RNA helicase n=1 Tax=Amanita muscaria (strain Koide BX008) TaxID=946122 RepID=A0A0C2SRX9_AMAMK|nr:hypothetical protein M378DRAFT_113290 [Amanita muscaria Koide BX008]
MLRSTSRFSSAVATVSATNVPSSTTSTPTLDTLPFSSLETSVHPSTLRPIIEKPFSLVTMSSVQSRVLPLLPGLAMPYQTQQPGDAATPRDLLVKAKTGTGKTLAFLVPAIESRLRAISQHVKKSLSDGGLISDKILESKAKRSFAMNRVGALIISPTRELGTQIANEALRLLTYHGALDVQLLVGGESRRKQVRDWSRRRKDIVVATPGRLRDLLNEKEFADAFAHTQLLILDEADSLLDMGFRDDIDAITEYLPPTPERQTFLFSATVSSAIRQVAREVLDKRHVFINCVNDADAPVHTHIKQYHTVLPSAADQVPHLLRLLAHEQLANPGSSKTIMFFPTTKMTQLFTSMLKEIKKSALPAGNNTRIYEIHSKKTMESRTRTSADFRADKSGAAVLVSSDVSARGVDYPGVTRVIQVGVPSSKDQYVHRVGRTGRGGEGGREGRGDLVLLPWEMGFVTCQLGEVPLKPVTVKDMEKQVKEMAIKVDEDPKAYFNDFGKAAFGLQGRASSAPTGPRLFLNVPGYASVVDQVDVKVEEMRSEMDESAVDETFMSMLGYYSSRTGEMKTDKMTVLEGLKDWAVDCGGMMKKPTVSMMMMQRLGIVEDRPSRRSPRSGQRGEQKRGFGLKKKTGGDRWEGERQGKVKEWEWREGKQSMYGVDRGRAQADWRDREGKVKRIERDARDGRHWMERGRTRRD